MLGAASERHRTELRLRFDDSGEWNHIANNIVRDKSNNAGQHLAGWIYERTGWIDVHCHKSGWWANYF